MITPPETSPNKGEGKPSFLDAVSKEYIAIGALRGPVEWR